MADFNFDEPPAADAAIDIATECQRQLRPLVHDILQAAVVAGWSQKDVLLALVDVAWDLYEDRRGDH
ncbi:hypothetical protein [Rhizobium sp. RCC_161_2]|uniref:hypothetical protein n=1 Tax=Rhizobium sp. RCC_161_2 TaxID=3239219 RepID=UPI00352602B3